MYIEGDEKKKYLEQWDTVERRYKRVMEASAGGEKQDDKKLFDDVRAFFVDCYHLKDWVAGSRSDLVQKVEDLFDSQNGIECFQVCADLVNRSKHFALTKRIRKDKDTRFVSQNVHVYVGVVGDGTSATSRYSWDVESGGKRYDAYNLARDCMGAWRQFMSDHQLLSTEVKE